MWDKNLDKFKCNHLFNHFSGDIFNYLRKFIIKKFINLLDDNSSLQQQLGMPDYNNPENPRWTGESAKADWEKHVEEAKNIYTILTGRVIIAEEDQLGTGENNIEEFLKEDLRGKNLYNPAERIKIHPEDIDIKADYLIINFENSKTQKLFQRYLFRHGGSIERFIEDNYDTLELKYEDIFKEYHIAKGREIS
jgi:hypothetical protein